MTTAVEDIVLAAASVEIEAGADVKQKPSVAILGYGGGIMRVPGWGDIAIDLAGVDAAGQVPILADHDPRLSGIVGHGVAQVRDGKLYVAGTIADSTEAARQIVDLAKGGFAFGASVGVEPTEHVRVAPGEAVRVNGRALTAPKGGMVLVQKGRLREISITALAADPSTSVAIAAARRNTMETTTDVTEEVATERQRVAGIMKITAKNPDIATKAVAEGWDTTRTELEVLRASRPKAPAYGGGGTIVATAAVIAAALAFRMGMGKVAEKQFQPEVLDQAHSLRAAHCMDLCRMALTADGQDIPLGREAMVKAALSNISLPTALGDLASKNLLEAYMDAPAAWRSFAAIRSPADFKTNTTIRPSFTGSLEQVAPGGELKHGTIKEWTASYKIDTFGKMLSVDRRDLINDDLGLFADASAALGRTAMRKLNDLVFSVLLTNAGAFFSVGNVNYLSGVDSALNMTSLAAAIKAMISQRDDEGNDLDIRPAVLLVPPDLETTGRALLESEYIMAAVNSPTGNSLRNVVKLETEPRLANATKFGNLASTLHWYLFAGPQAAAMVVAFLNGIQTPTIEFQGVESDINTLAAKWRVYHDFGAALIDPRAAVRSKGQA